MSEEEAREEKHREISQIKGIEGVFAKRYPELYEKLKIVSQQTGQSLLDLIASYTNWAIELRQFSTLVTPEDLKHITPEALYSALKMIMFFEERYIRLVSYINVSQALAIFDALRQLLLYQTVPTTQGQPSQPLLPLMPPQPSKIDRLIDAIIKGIEVFSMGREDVRRQIAEEVAKRLIELAQTPPQATTQSQK